jgi:uncharacterized membrane protein
MPSPTQANIESVVRLEQKALEQRSLSQHVGDVIADFAGTMQFVLLHVIVFVCWVLINAGKIPFIPKFDPFPYILLTMIVSLEGVLVSTFVLIKQNRMSKRADQRDQLNLQIDLLAEKEVTKILQMQRQLCEHFGLMDMAKDPEAKEMSQETVVDTLADELNKRLPEE